jgi:hypothetical protein
MFRVASASDLVGRAALALISGAAFFLTCRRVFEREFADQIVTVSPRGIAWARSTKWWTRQRSVKTSDVTEVSASTGWGGLGRVDITAKGRRHTILDELLSADAVRFADELKQATRGQ